MEEKSKDNLLPLYVEDENNTMNKKVIHNNISCEGSVMIVSIVNNEESISSIEDEGRSLLIGMLFSLLAVTSLTFGHTIIKVLSISSPYITSCDTLLFMGIFNVPISFTIGLFNGVDMNVFSYPKFISSLILTRGLFGLLSNGSIMIALSYIPLSKAIFILSLNPIVCAILAGIFLKEKISPTTIVWIFGAAVGIYLLTLNNQADETAENRLIGYTFMIFAILLSGAIFTMIRTLNLYNIHVCLNSGTLGIFLVLQSVIAYSYDSELINFDKYTLTDLGLLWALGLFSIGWIWGWFFATKFAQASVVSPMSNLENLTTLLFDIFFFHYHFVKSDIIGLSVLSVCIVAGVASRYFQY